MLLQFLSIDHFLSLTKKFDIDFWIAELTKNSQNKEIEISNYLELLPLLNSSQNYTLKESLLNYRLVITQKQKSLENLHIRIQLSTEDSLFLKIKKALTVFTSTTIFHSHNEVIFIIKNINRNSVFVPLILDYLKQITNEITFLFVENVSKQYTPLADLYDYQTQKWYLS